VEVFEALSGQNRTRQFSVLGVEAIAVHYRFFFSGLTAATVRSRQILDTSSHRVTIFLNVFCE
jgi:hypothetical protein